jgi:hypothetical protein
METLPALGDRPDGPLPCFIEFRVTDQERFHDLCHAFEILKHEKLQYLEVALGRKITKQSTTENKRCEGL